MSSEDMWLRRDEEVQLAEEKGLETDSGAADFGEPMLDSTIWGCQLWPGHGEGREADPRKKKPCLETLICIAALRKSEIFSERRNWNMKLKQLWTAIWHWQYCRKGWGERIVLWFRRGGLGLLLLQQTLWPFGLSSHQKRFWTNLSV